MTAWQYILASLRQFRRVHLATAAGVAVTTAVITGALLVGDSMRGSLRDLALRGLGRVDSLVLAEHPFRAKLAAELLATPAAKARFTDALPLLLTRGAATLRTDSGDVRRATGLSVYGVTPQFWSLATSPTSASSKNSPAAVNAGNEIALTADVARELDAKPGDFVILRIPLPGATPADSALGEKEDASASRRLQVTTILPDDRATMARFSVRPSQQAPRNAFVPLETLQSLLERPGDANAIALATNSIDAATPIGTLSALGVDLHPELADYGVTVENVPHDAAPYIRISADRLVLPEEVVRQAYEISGDNGLQPVITYLANTIVAGERKIPYSTVAGVISTADLGPVVDDSGNPIFLAKDEIALNEWAAEDLQVKVGDEITITFYDPETTHGVLREHEPLRLKLRAIVPLADAEGKPTSAADPKFAPELPGVTDQDSIESWKLPFELVEKVRDKDEKYWDDRRTTPKAFVSPYLARQLWSTRWGTDSVLRIPAVDGRTAETIAAALKEKIRPAGMGITLIPAKRQALAAASGTTPFDGLFLGFSFFLMASAAMLTALLFRLGIEGRAREVGLLLASGFSPKRVRDLFMIEGAIVALVGAAIGAAAGVAYAALMVHGLNTWWVDATAAPFLELHVTPGSIAIGLAAGLVVAMATIWWSLRSFAKLPARQLLAGDHQPSLTLKPAAPWSSKILPLACIVASVALGLAALRFEGEAQAGAFFTGGALALVGILAAVRGKLREAAAKAPTSLTLAGLAARNVRRNPSRTMLSLALAATASFLIVALSAFRLAPTERGTGGFDLIATADLPLHYDLSSPEGRKQLGFSDAVNQSLAGAQFIGFRVHDGEDASCLNLYQTTQPRILGAPLELGNLSEFRWAGTGSWLNLASNLGDRPTEDERPIIPMVLDRNTAFYSLKLYALGSQLKVRDSADRETTLQIIGLLANSILQGDAIISEANFLRLFPEVAGRRYFLIKRGPDSPSTAELASLLETQLEDFGFDAVDARSRLAELMAVQNTYLSTFQSLGALGLLLGAVGLAVVQLRSVIERRGELALMQAAGFRRRRLARMVLAENLVLLLGGLSIGCAAALAAVLPHAAIEQVGAPWATLALLLAIVAATGAAAAWFAARTALRAPLIPALRGD